MLWCLPSGRVGNERDVPTTLQIKSLSSSWEDTLRIDHMNVSSTIISASSREVSAQWCFKMIPRFIFAEKKLNSDCNLSFKALNHQYCSCCFSDCAAGIFTVCPTVLCLDFSVVYLLLVTLLLLVLHLRSPLLLSPRNLSLFVKAAEIKCVIIILVSMIIVNHVVFNYVLLIIIFHPVIGFAETQTFFFIYFMSKYEFLQGHTNQTDLTGFIPQYFYELLVQSWVTQSCLAVVTHHTLL